MRRLAAYKGEEETKLARKVIGPTGSRRRHWLFLVCLALAATTALLFIGGAFGSPEGNPPGVFALDKNATHNLKTPHVGIIKSSITSTATTMTVCEYSGTPTLTAGDILMIDAEQMTFVSYGATSNQTGGCSFTDPSITPTRTRVYTVTRHANSTTAASHAGDADITQLTSSGALPGNDWDQIYNAVTNNPTADNPCSSAAFQFADGSAVACDWLSDPPGTTIFTGGSSDIADVNTWSCTNQSVPDADEILHAYAAKYSNSNQYLYFGADRYATNGAKDFGFWFFKNPISSSGDTISNTCPNGAFSGTHSLGDVLVLGTFTQGGAVGSIRVFEWVGTGGDTNGTLQSLGTFGDCVPGAASDKGCNTINNTTIQSPWTYQGKGGAGANVIYSGGFMEGGLDLEALGLTGCFSSFMAETRSSPSLTAALKDFTIGRFEACGSSLTTTPKGWDGTTVSNLSADSNDNNLVETSIGTGSVQVKDSADFAVNGTPDFTGTLSFHICGPIASGTCDSGGVAAGSQTVTANGTYTSDPVTLTEIGRYCWRSDFASDTEGVPDASDSTAESADGTGECFEVLPVTPSLSTTAWSSGDALGSAQTDPVPFGDPVYDKASLSGTATEPGDNGGSDPGQPDNTYPSINATNGADADGSITFTLYGPGDCTTVATGSSGTNPETGVTVSGDGDYFSSGFTPDSPGDFHWVASYSGSTSGNTGGTDHNTDCTDTDEDVTVQQLQPTMDTNQSFDPKDSATVSVDGGAGDLDGNVVFNLYVNNSTCDGTADYSSDPIAVSATDTGAGTTLTDTVSWDSGHFFSTDGTTFNWVVEFQSNNTAHKDVTSNCTENSSIAIANGDQANTP